jgi:hypothetical protein
MISLKNINEGGAVGAVALAAAIMCAAPLCAQGADGAGTTTEYPSERDRL